MINDLNIPEDKLKEMQEAAKKLGDQMGGIENLKMPDITKGFPMRVLKTVDILLNFMEEYPEYQNQYLVESMKDYISYLDSMIVGSKQ